MSSMVVDDLLVNYQVVGKGRVLVLLHGWGDTSATFKPLLPYLAQNYQVVTLDLPGFGNSQAPKDVWNLTSYAQFVAAFLKKANIKPFAFIAHSNGGSVAIHGLAEGTLQSEKLVLLASAGIRDRQKVRRLVLKVIAKTGKVATFWLPTSQKKKLQKALYGAAGSDMMVAPQLQETFKVTVRQDVQADAKRLTLPTLLIYGNTDKATPPLYGRIYQKLIPGSTLFVIDDADHFVHQTKTEQVATHIKEFL